MECLQYHVAGLPVMVREATPGALDDLAPVYRAFPTNETPLLIIDLARVSGFDRERSAQYPAFERLALPDGRIRVERFDAEGEISTGDLPLRAAFRVGPSANSVEACLRIAASMALPRAGALILHASAVEHAGRALVFAGHSGAGKSTMSSLLSGLSGACTKIADELVVIRRAGTSWELVVPPYLGPAGVSHGATASLASINMLVQAPWHVRTLLSAPVALRAVLRNTLAYVGEPRTAGYLLHLADEISASVPCYRLECRNDAGVATALGITIDRRGSS